MRAPQFWWRPAGPLAGALFPVSAVYGWIAGRRLAQAGMPSPLPCICIGNFVAGGAGKTPTAIAIAHRLRKLGRAPVFLTRGYGGRLSGPLQVDPAMHGWTDVGDEALLLAQVAPTIVARDRKAGAQLAPALGDVLVMDDGFQNPSLRKDLSILVIDGEQGVGNGRVIPAGPLRAPFAAQLRRADAILSIGDGPGRLFAGSLPLPLLHGELQVPAGQSAKLQGLRLLAFCGIGRPQKFFATLEKLGAILVEGRSFADHHWYTDPEARELLGAAAKLGVATATTAKDAVRLTGSHSLLTLAKTTHIVRVDLVVQDETALDRLLMSALDRPQAGS